MADEITASSRQRADEILTVTRSAAERCDRPDLVQRVDQAISRLANPDVTVLVIGEFKQGKSSLVNALLNAPVCPVDDDVATAVPTIIRHADTPIASIVYDGPDDPDATIEATVTMENAAAFVRSGRIAGSEQRVRSVEIGLPRKLLAGGLRLVDTPGVGGLDSAHGMATMGALAMADAVVFVSDCSQELTGSELEFLRRAVDRCPSLTCVMPKRDFYTRWADIAERNRAHVEAFAPAVEVTPVSSVLRKEAVTRNDRELNDESGFSALLEFLWATVDDREQAFISSAMNDVRVVLDHLESSERSEHQQLSDPTTRETLVEQARKAQEQAERMKSASSRWSTTLNDGIVDLTSDSDHDMRQRTRSLLAEIDGLIDENDPTDIGDELFPMIERRLMDDIAENYRRTATQATDLSERVLELFDAETPVGELPSIAAPVDLVSDVGSLDVDINKRPSSASSFLTGMRGSYGGVMMFGMLGSVVGLATFGPLSIGAGVLLGRKAAKEERKRQLTVRRQQAKQGVRKYVDDVTFQVNKHSRDTLRQIQRDLRDANLSRARELSATATATLKAAQSAVQADEASTKQRLAELDASLDQLQRIRVAATEVEQR